MKRAATILSVLSITLVPLTFSGCMRRASIRAPVGGFALTSQRITLPYHGREFAGGPQASVANTYCLMCHSGGMVMTQPPLSLSAWKAELNKMKNAYGCPLPQSEVDELARFIQEHNQRSASAAE
jgi:hypothetical protein